MTKKFRNLLTYLESQGKLDPAQSKQILNMLRGAKVGVEVLQTGIKVIYSTGEIDRALDDRIIEALGGAGFRWWASGYNLETDERDLAFDLPPDL